MSDLSPAPDGSVLAADPATHTVKRMSADGTITTVAGSGTLFAPGGFSGDGGPATSAALNDPRGVAALPVGGFVIADSGNRRIRRVTPDGRIETVAGTGSASHSGDGGPAVGAGFGAPQDVAVASDGSLLVADNDRRGRGGRVRRLTIGGTIETAAGGSRSRAYAELPHGTFPADPFDSDGALAGASGLPRITSVTAAADGGVLIGDSRKVRWAGPANAERLAVGISGARLGRERGTLTYRVTRAAHVKVTVVHHRSVRFTAAMEAAPGSNTIAVGSLAPGARHRIALTATTDAGQQATDLLPDVFPGRLLTPATADRAAGGATDLGQDGGESIKQECPRRVRGASVDCRILSSLDGARSSACSW